MLKAFIVEKLHDQPCNLSELIYYQSSALEIKLQDNRKLTERHSKKIEVDTL
jgi:hypothetical protein